MEAVRTLKANLKLEGKPCGWCQVPLKIGEDTSVCTACEKEHHGRCWDGKAGCSTASCANAPLKQLEPAVVAGVTAAAALAPGLMHCPSCRTPIPMGAMLCPVCRAITSPDGIYHGPKMNAPGAVQSLVYGLIGLVFCNIILGPIAISKSNSAKQAIASDPTLTGGGYATAGLVLGIIDIALFAVFAMVRLSAK